MELAVLKNKYANHFIFRKSTERMTLSEAKELVGILEALPINLENEEMMWKLRGYISKQDYENGEKKKKEDELKQASKDLEMYHEELKKLGVQVIQPGISHNEKIDHIHVTYHLGNEIIYKWMGGISVIKMRDQMKEVYERLIL